jgi:hypothetical protein
MKNSLISSGFLITLRKMIGILEPEIPKMRHYIGLVIPNPMAGLHVQYKPKKSLKFQFVSEKSILPEIILEENSKRFQKSKRI